MNILAFDIEANGLRTATQVHCGVVENIETGERHEFTNGLDLYTYLLTADRIVAHNGRMYDCPTLERLVGRPNNLPPLPPCFDTVLVSRLLWPDKGNTPANGHSLEKWGEFLKVRKAHAGIEDWSVFTPEMLERCHSDVDIQVKLYHYLLPKIEGWGESVQIEHTVASIIQKQIENGFPIDLEALQALEHTLNMARLEAMDSLSHIEPWIEEEEMKKPAYWYNPFDEDERYPTKGEAPSKVRKDLVRGPNWVKRTEVPFNPNSGTHIERLFREKYGWKPKQLTKTGAAVTDAKVIKSLDYPEARTIATMTKLKTLLGYTDAWRRFEVNGRIHGDVITQGTGSSRMSHSKPNMNIPKVGKPYGKECRSCFTHRPGWILLGCDAQGLQERGLAHYMHKWDGGEYARAMESGSEEEGTDSHSLWCKALGYEPQKVYTFGTETNKAREQAKTHKYATMFGGQLPRQASILGISKAEMKKKEAMMYARLPGLQKATNWVKGHVRNPGYFVGLDGRHIPLPKEHSSLAFVLQGFEAVVMKKALCLMYARIEEEVGPHGERWGLVVNIHDEYELECEPEVADTIGPIMAWGIEESGRHFNLNVGLKGKWAKGRTWADVH